LRQFHLLSFTEGEAAMEKQSHQLSNHPRNIHFGQKFASHADGVSDSIGSIHYHRSLAGHAELFDVAEPLFKNAIKVSLIMERNLMAVNALDSVAKVEELLFVESSPAVPVIDDEGAVIGIIGPQELTRFHFGKKNTHAVQAWEISRCTMFAVSPDDGIDEVAKMMADNKLDYIAVTEDGILQGILSLPDLIHVILNDEIERTGKYI
jgi:predicted transcriptional regulator